ncbi:RagB/SusD family nutrient uptake outer membrane protein [Pseudochryseolinea flava]|uniref:RagB/SusD family nutrient uptake outer membrane protein n=1 Tax=Pseudochryseolinea flava TaxID=2059302 RepID=A0A364Y6C8_9BACT|nr:RagB/SusD family nutrient uptake outer membrane protein [Pseudochryseolinea flava]RAW02429.1 RagB/SusD family nutrient uptake outer membrane protein [Pseudochryseolinea flava]
MKKIDVNIKTQQTNATRPFRLGIWLLTIGLTFSVMSCDNYLDVVPDDITTIDHAFSLANETEKYLFTCYSYLPKNGDGWYNVGMMAGDEIWLPNSATFLNNNFAFALAQGGQSSNAPLLDAWTGWNNGALGGYAKRLFAGIRACNIFIENVSDLNKVPDLDLDTRVRWLGEVAFLKAYYHFHLFRMYGPIPIIDKNVPIDADVTSNYVVRQPVDSCVNYMSRLFDDAISKLPNQVQIASQEMGRVTKPIALAMKAKLLVTAASPLFNGNPDFADFVDKGGVNLFNSSYDATKWQRARDACKAAIDLAEQLGHELHRYEDDQFTISNTAKTQLSIRQAVSQPWNDEIIWGNTNSQFEWYNQNLCQAVLTGDKGKNRLNVPGAWEVPIKIAKLFYTANGVPIEEDKTLDFASYEDLRTATTAERLNIKEGYVTARLNFDRENRFYADLGFDGGIWYKRDAANDETKYYAQTKFTDPGGIPSNSAWNETGYYPKKLVNWEMQFIDDTGVTFKAYPWPEIRLADLYLLYAETLNETSPASTEAIEYLDKIRERAGLAGVVESWTNFSTDADKYTTQEGLREIIHRERTIELAFEGHRFWDLRRWRKAAEELNKDITGWNYRGTTSATYHRETHIFSQTFVTPRDYLWPIGIANTRQNPRLVENPGW